MDQFTDEERGQEIFPDSIVFGLMNYLQSRENKSGDKMTALRTFIPI